ncbi:hypothetical protein DY000_02033080 [Brassica cretica]|uniref:Nudix hydrolase domain-containing protein n=1 Tax=Brassica cretica TaxID=69181 RepID=A0ABQ7DHC4_BRACR|nr:hypothetical protein DY000_02033080 [Brassica cretica]
MSTKRRTSSWECERIRNISGTAGLERIPSGDVSEALAEVLREETRSLGHPLMDCPIIKDPDSIAHLVRHFKPVGFLHPSLQNMTECDTYVKMDVAHSKDTLRSDELYEMKKLVHELKLSSKHAALVMFATAPRSQQSFRDLRIFEVFVWSSSARTRLQLFAAHLVIMLTLFSGAGGGKLGNSSSVSLLILLEVTFVFPSACRHSSVECLFRLWKVQYLLGLKFDGMLWGELFSREGMLTSSSRLLGGRRFPARVVFVCTIPFFQGDDFFFMLRNMKPDRVHPRW